MSVVMHRIRPAGSAHLRVCSVTTFMRLDDARCCAYGDCDLSSSTCHASRRRNVLERPSHCMRPHHRDREVDKRFTHSSASCRFASSLTHLAVADILRGQGEHSQVLLRLRAFRRILHRLAGPFSLVARGVGEGGGGQSTSLRLVIRMVVRHDEPAPRCVHDKR